MWLLARHAGRTLPILPLLTATGAGVLLVTAAGPDAHLGEVLLRLRGAGMLLAVALVFAFDDPAATVTDHVPTPRWLRWSVNAVVTAAPAVPLWVLLLALADRRAAEPVPWVFSVELLAVVTLGWAIAATTARRRPTSGGIVAGSTLVALLLSVQRLPERLSLFPFGPTDPQWVSAHLRWTGLLVAAALVLALATRDPAAQVLANRRCPRSPPSDVRPGPDRCGTSPS